MNNDYPVRLYYDERGTDAHWVAEFQDLPGCIGVGNTMSEALEDAEANKNNWLEIAAELGKEIPIPSTEYATEYSGKFNLRLPIFLHRDLTLLAIQQGVSLNTFCISILSESKRIISENIPCTSYAKTKIESSYSSGIPETSNNWQRMFVQKATVPQEKRVG